CVSRRDRAAGRRPHRRRRPLPGDGHHTSFQRNAPARTTPARQRGAGGPLAGRHHPRTANHDERKRMSELRERIQAVIETEPVTLFMKGTPQFIMCGNSDRALRALRAAGAPVTAVDVLPDPAIRQELSALSGWPTIPQLFVGGELVGGADIVQELSETGELTRILETKLGAAYRDDAEVRVVDVLVPTQR